MTRGSSGKVDIGSHRVSYSRFHVTRAWLLSFIMGQSERLNLCYARVAKANVRSLFFRIKTIWKGSALNVTYERMVKLGMGHLEG